MVGPGDPAAAQEPRGELGVTAPSPAPPTPELGLQRTLPLEQRRGREQDFYFDPPKARYEPAFITPFVATVPTGKETGVRFGLSGWTAPAVPFDIPQNSGGVAFGLTFQWGVPLGEAQPAAPASIDQR
jgi:hypothetical protein